MAEQPLTDEQQLTIAAYKAVFAADDANAQRVLANLASYCKAHDESVIFDCQSSRITTFNLGKNDVYRHIMWMLKRKTEPKQTSVISERKIL